MTAEHLEILVEEPSMEAFLGELLPRLLGDRATFSIYPHQGKHDLLANLGARLRGYRSWLPADWRIVILVDRDNEDCELLKRRMEQASLDAGLRTRSVTGEFPWQVVNRIAIEELEAWYFGAWTAVHKSYPRVSVNIPNKAPYRYPDEVAEGTWEAFERVLKQYGYFPNGLRKIEVARTLGKEIDPAANTSPSFMAFRDAIMEAVI